MSLSVKTRGGGSGLYASIFVTGLSETDIVSASKDGKTVQGVWVEGSSTSGFLIAPIKSFGTWTVTATNGTKSDTQNVLVDVATEFEIEMGYKLWLYRDGDECENATGGYKDYWFSSSWAKGNTAVRNADNIFMQASSGTSDGYSCGIATNNLISFSGYTKLCILVDSNADSSNELFMVLNSAASSYENTNKAGEYLHKTAVTYGVVEMDISSYQNSYQVSILTIRNEYCRLYRMWLE